MPAIEGPRIRFRTLSELANYLPAPVVTDGHPTETLMVASTLQPVETGQEFAVMPPHVTVFPWFELETPYYAGFLADLDEVMLENRSGYAPTAQDPVFFGPNEDMAAKRLLMNTRDFNFIQHFQIHAGVYRSVNSYAAAYDPTYVGLKYNPHITDSAEHTAEEGAVLPIDNLTVFQKDTERRVKIVREVLRWSKAA